MLYFQVFFCFLLHSHLHVFLNFFDVFLISLNVSLIFYNLFVRLYVGFHCCFDFVFANFQGFWFVFLDIQVQLLVRFFLFLL